MTYDDDSHTVADACATARASISLDADGELRDRIELDEHLAHCAMCVQYVSRVAGLSRRLRLRPARHDAAFVAKVMNDAHVTRLGRGRWLRPALAWCALLSALYSVRPLFFGDVHGADTHVARHLGATSLALAIGFLLVAWKPNRAAGLLPFVAALAGTTIVAAGLDLASGATGGVAETVHLAEVIGMVLLWMIAGSPGWNRVLNGWATLRASARPTS